jgi:hypothetical protein
MRRSGRLARRGLLPFAVFMGILSVGVAAPVAAQAQSAWWKLDTTSTPTDLVPGSEAFVTVEATNIGDAAAAGNAAPIVVTAKLPSWLEPTAVTGVAGPEQYYSRQGVKGVEGLLGTMSSCALHTTEPHPSVSCEYPESLPPFGTLELIVTVKVGFGAPVSGASQETIEGGETPGISVSQTLTTGASTPFGVEGFELVPENEGGTVDTQAGSHPFQLTTTFNLNENAETESRAPESVAPTGPELVKDLQIKLPQGLVGDANVVPQCSEADFTTEISGAFNLCPGDTAVGVALLTINEPFTLGYSTDPVPIFNLTPPRGEPARFGFDFESDPVVLDTSIRTGGDYGVDVNVNNVSEAAALVRSQAIFWGVPGEKQHAVSRGWGCVVAGLFVYDYGAKEESCVAQESAPQALLTLPSSCSGSVHSSVAMDSWGRPGQFTSPKEYTLTDRNGNALSLDGCNRLAFEPSIKVTPDHEAGSTPTGFTVDIHVPQEQTLDATGLAPTDVKDISVTLPKGVQANPAVANGLSACSEGQVGLDNANEASCPETSKIGTAEITTPLLNHTLKGSVYVAAQTANPFGSLLALYLVVKDPISGVLIKLAGKVSPDPLSGQLTATFEGTPELPFEDASVHFFDGPRTALSTPSECGTYETKASLVPWSGEEALNPSSTFQITSGPNGAPCVNTQPFSPGFQAGTASPQAGAFSPLSVSVSRPDGDQALGSVTTQLPPGLAGDLTNVPLCPEPAAAEGHCPASSLIGSVTVEAGLGNEPVTVEGGEVFLTGPYNGAPFGLSIVTTAKAGPFNLGVVVVRAAVSVNPNTAAVTATTGALPTILQGIPLQLKAVKVTINRGSFIYNPTNCTPASISGSVASSTETKSAVSSYFQVANCAALGFKPKFAASTTSKASKKYGASLDVKLSLPKVPFNSQANIAKIKVDLPKQLPTRLTTLHEACPAAVFAASPANCPKHSVVGEAIAVTPILPVPLKGSAYLVSHGGEAFPNLVLLLQGYGITIDVTGATNIKKGITSETFNTVPDAPLSSVEMKLPQGEFSLLAAYGNLCTPKTLPMPTAFQGQNGAEIHETTNITVTGCPKHKAAKTKHKAAKAKKTKRRGK